MNWTGQPSRVNTLIETKADMVEIILARIFAVFRGATFQRVIERFVRRHYAKGMTEEEITLKLRTNVIPDEEKLSLLTNETHTEIVSLMGDLEKQYQQTVREAVRNNESPDMIKRRLKALLNPGDATIHTYGSGRKMNWRDRLDMIQVTESHKAANQGRLDTMKQSGLPIMKYVSIHDDDRTSDICIAMGKKYGDPKKAIPLNESFEVRVKGQLISAQACPFHPHCRSRVMSAFPEDQQ